MATPDPHAFGTLASADGDLRAVIDTAIRSAEPHELDEAGQLVGVVVPDGGRLELVDVTARLAGHQPEPARASGTYKTATVQSFIDITRRHESTTLTVWVHPTSGRVVAVLNDHGPSQDPEWGDHRAELQLLHTEEWQRWAKHDGKLLDQESFAEHIQDGLTEIASPPGAELLEIAQTMQGTTSAAWKAGVRLADGQVQIGYTEQADATAGRDGQLAIPTEFQLVLAPFVGEDVVAMDAHLRWRVRGGNLHIGYKLDNPQRVLRDALEKVAARLGEEFPGAVYFGEPRS